MTDFKTVLSSPLILKALDDLGFSEATPIQAASIPAINKGRDLVGLAQTGTGKTASFSLPTLEKLLKGRTLARMPRALILAPSRELAAQIDGSFEELGKYTKLKRCLITGGTSMPQQIEALKKSADIVIATPGRLMDLFKRGEILLNRIEIFVIDEADRMLDMGFIPDIEYIVGLLPTRRQTLLFSATMPKDIERLASKILVTPERVEVTPPRQTAKTITQKLIDLGKASKFEALRPFLEAYNIDSAFIFCNRKRDIDQLTRKLKGTKLEVAGLHGDMQQKERTQKLDEFREGKLKYLICSDVLARGIDIDNVPHVINFDLPMHPDDYIHRIGRTGRAGSTGHAWSFYTPKRDDEMLEAIEKHIQETLPRESFSIQGGEGKKQPENIKDFSSRKEGGKEKNGIKSHNQSGNKTKGFGDHVPGFMSQ